MEKLFLSRFLRGSASTTAGTLVTVFFHFVSIMILARYMPKEAFGVYSLVIVISHGLQIVGGLGLNLTLVKFQAGDEPERRAYFSGILLLRAGLLAGLALVVGIWGDRFLPALFDAEIEPYLAFVPAIFVLASLRDLFFHYLQAQRLFGPYAMVQVLSSVVRLASIGVFLAMDGLAIEYLLWIEIITYGSSLIHLLTWVPLRTLFKVPREGFVYRNVFGFGGPLYMNDILTYVYNRTSVLLIGSLLTPISVATYEVASKVPDGFSRLFSALIVVYFPSMSDLLREGQVKAAERFMNGALALVSAGLTFAATCGYFFREELVVTLYSAQYRSAALLFALLMINFSLDTVSRLMGYTIVAAGHSSVPVRVNLVSSVLNFAGCLYFLPRFGEIGAVYALFGMSAATQVLNHRYLAKAGIDATVVSYLVPFVLLAFLIALQALSGFDHPLFRAGLVLSYPAMCWVSMPEVRRAGRYLAHVLARRAARRDRSFRRV
jgi:O-antigen/teichoic acid export membrane protein